MPMQNDTYGIEITCRARQDIIDIGDYMAYILLEPNTSQKFIHSLRNKISTLSVFPYKYPVLQDNNLIEQEIRCMPYHNYYVFYKVIKNRNLVIILRIGYKRRNWKDILKV